MLVVSETLKISFTVFDFFSHIAFMNFYYIQKIKTGNVNSTNRHPCFLWSTFMFLFNFSSAFALREEGARRSKTY